MSNLKEKLFEQRNIGKLWGKFAIAGSKIAMFVSGYTVLMVSVNAYSTVSSLLATFGINIRFFVYMGIVLMPLILAYLLAWKYLVRSFYGAWAKQFWKEDNPVVKQLEKMESTNKDILERLTAIEKNQERSKT